MSKDEIVAGLAEIYAFCEVLGKESETMQRWKKNTNEAIKLINGTGEEINMKVTKIYCDCCGQEINKSIDTHLYVTVKTDLSDEQHYCAKCGQELMRAWIEKMKELNHKSN